MNSDAYQMTKEYKKKKKRHLSYLHQERRKGYRNSLKMRFWVRSSI